MTTLIRGLLAAAVVAGGLAFAAPANADTGDQRAPTAEPGTAEDAPATGQAGDPSSVPGVDSVDTDTGVAAAEPSQHQADAGPSTPEPYHESPSIVPSRPSAPNSGRRVAASQKVAFSTQIVTPSDGAGVPAGQVEYTVQLASAGDYWLDLYCDESPFAEEYLPASQDGQQFTGTIGPVNAGDNCGLTLYDSSWITQDDVFFTANQPVVVPEIRNPAARPQTFYPRVRDGYRDHTDIGFGSRLDSDVTVKIINRNGYAVRTFIRDGRDWADYYERRSVAWNGKNMAGNLVPTGRYTAVITSRLEGRSDTARVPLWVQSGHRTVRVTRTQDGWYDSIDQTRGNCYAWETPDGNDLDCWGGRFAQATYRFSLPSNARNIDWGVRGHRECCSPGRITKTGHRTSARSFRIVVRVTNWRSYVVRGTWVTFTYRKAI